MGEKKGTTVLLTVIGIATLIVTLVGATFAYFTANVTGNDENKTDVVVTAADLGTIVFEHSDTVSLDNAYPGATDTVDFKVKPADGASVGVDYQVYLMVDSNTFTSNNLTATLTAPQGDTASLTNPVLNNTNYAVSADGYLIGSGTIEPNTEDNWSLTVLLNEIDAAQTEDEGKTFTARVKVVVEGTGNYTQDSVYGPATTN